MKNSRIPLAQETPQSPTESPVKTGTATKYVHRYIPRIELRFIRSRGMVKQQNTVIVSDSPGPFDLLKDSFLHASDDQALQQVDNPAFWLLLDSHSFTQRLPAWRFDGLHPIAST
jgi:hypothetical protein